MSSEVAKVPGAEIVGSASTLGNVHREFTPAESKEKLFVFNITLPKPLTLKWGETVMFDFVPENDSVSNVSDLLDLSHLIATQREKLSTLNEYSDVFLRKDQKLGCTDQICHSIETGYAKRIYVRLYRMSQKESLKEWIQIMLRR
ncbi:hypothetical protein PR048_020006 [Dryococelus australis]|uniref:Uncharacterized protein n=1 Tax=Dryococelus australis TaxID=614101 RepID=A0ABQ9H5G0_9NEOP|nr:hypothetical protein PR048_020006 [Dryococelus australis]